MASEDAVSALSRAFTESAVRGSLAEWAAAVGSLQRVVDVASAAQDAAIARLAAIETEALEDGTFVESHRALGYAALDAPAIVSGVLSVSAVWAERRVRSALRLAADGPAGTETATGLGALHEAMAAGRLDAYRASVIADELEEAPAEVRAAVVAALDEHLEAEDGTHLRRRCRRALEQVSPDLLRQRARRARAESTLRRWAEEPGVDKWEGTFPSEEAAQAWAAIDALAQRYVADGLCPTIGRARAKALTDLVAGNATIETTLIVTVPADAVGGSEAAPGPEARDHGTGAGRQDLVEVTGPSRNQPVLVARGWLSAMAAAGEVRLAGCHPGTGAVLDLGHGPAPGRQRLERPCGPEVVARVAASALADVGADRYRPTTRVAELVRTRDRRCRFPGCSISARFCDLDHVRPWPRGRTAPDNLLCVCRRHHRVKQRPGWRIALAPDGMATWTDPTGRVRTSAPVDALHSLVIPGAAAPEPGHGASGSRTVLPDGPHSALEFRLEHLSATAPQRRPSGRDDRGHGVEVRPAQGILVVEPSHRRPRGPGRAHHRPPPEADHPPF